MLATAIYLIVTTGSWATLYLAFNPPSNESEDILLLEGFLALGLACTLTSIVLISLSTTYGLLMSVGMATYTLLYAMTSRQRCTQRRIEAHNSKAV